MRLRAVVIREGQPAVLEEAPVPGPDWRESDAMHWLIVEDAKPEELAQVFDRLGAEGAEVADHINGEQWANWRERKGHAIVALPEPTAWMEGRTWFHLVSLPFCFVSVHDSEIEVLDRFLRNWWLERPGPKASMEDVLLCLVECLAGEEAGEFSRIRFEVERHAAGLKYRDRSFSVERLEDLMTRTHHMATVFFELQRLCESLEFSRARHVELVRHTDSFRMGATNLRRHREGVEQVQRRLEELQRQHLMDQQKRTEGRVRVLTVISAIFLPLTLLSGIYGMNFVNMPELDDKYAYHFVLAGMVLLAVSMIAYFSRKGWFK